MNRAELWKRHFDLLDDANTETDPTKHREKRILLDGYRLAMDALGINYCVASDMHYVDRGIERPMTCGVWHQPEKLT